MAPNYRKRLLRPSWLCFVGRLLNFATWTKLRGMSAALAEVFDPWNDLTQQIVNLQSDNEKLLKEHEQAIEQLTDLGGQNRALSKSRNRMIEQRKLLRLQNKAQIDQIHKLQRENAEQKDLLRLQDEAKNYEICELQRENIKQQKQLQIQINVQNDQISELQRENLAQQKLLQLQAESKDGQIRELQKDILQYKKTISSSNSYAGQLSDTTIQNKMNALFHAIRDWAVDSIRHDDTLLMSLCDTSVEWLSNHIPGGNYSYSTQKVNALIALVSGGLAWSLERGWVFGASGRRSMGPVATANRLNTMIKACSAATFEKKRQWVLLTNGFISKNEEIVQRSLNIYAREIVQNVEQHFEKGDRDPEAMFSRLYSAIRPHIDVVQALYHQEADYSMHLVPVVGEGSSASFVPDSMEEINGEEEGILQASFFPIVYKNVVVDEKVESVVICKAKVMVEF